MNEAEWTKLARDHFVGRTIVSVRWMTAEEAEKNGYHRRPLVLYFEDGNWMCAQMDDEGNDAGAMAATGKIETWPVLQEGFETGDMAPYIKAHNKALMRNKVIDPGVVGKGTQSSSGISPK